ncbi:MAG: FkbM family methyltransferase [Myxococcota bacterium]|nr:FkbM family methyltransferase [Myxococcota bacterium]
MACLAGWLACGPAGEETVVEETKPRDRDAILTEGTSLYSAGHEELIIRHFFDDRIGGFFLDVGSSHWQHVNTTYYLEKHLGWSGIAVDARDEFTEGYARHRPRTRFFSYIVTDHSGTLDPFYRTGQGIHGDLSSTVEDHVELFVVDVDVEKVERPTITLNDLLAQNGVTNVDFLSMDIEEGEPAALAAFDIDRFRPELVCIEATQTVRKRIARYFEQHGYERIHKYLEYDRANWYYRPTQASR